MDAPAPDPPGEFVSDEHRADCARFLDEVKTKIRRRGELREDAGWIPAPRPLDSG